MEHTRTQNKTNTQQKKSKYSKTFTLRFPSDIRKEVQKIACRDDRSVGQVIRLALRDFIEKRAATV